MNELALFAGVGGGLLGTRLLGWTPVCAVEKEPYRREVLLRRQRDGVFPLFPIWDRIETFDGHPWRGKVDIITAGFPCQPFSCAGNQECENDERNMWPETIRVIQEVEPAFALLENVAGLLVHAYSHTVFGELAESGYSFAWDVLAASDFGASHIRERIFVLAYTDEERWDISGKIVPRFVAESMGQKKHMPVSRQTWMPGVRRRVGRLGRYLPNDGDYSMVDGDSFRMDELAAIGDAQVPAVVRAAWLLLSGEIQDED